MFVQFEHDDRSSKTLHNLLENMFITKILISNEKYRYISKNKTNLKKLKFLLNHFATDDVYIRMSVIS